MTDSKDQSTPTPRRPGLTRRLLRWALWAAGLVILAMALLTAFNLLRPLTPPAYLAEEDRPEQTMATPATTTQPTDVTPGEADGVTTSSPGMTKSEALSGADKAVTVKDGKTTGTTGDLIALATVADPGKRVKAAEINALCRRFVELLAQYEANPADFRARPAAERAPFDKTPFPNFCYRLIARRLTQAGFGQAELKRWNDTFMRQMVSYGDWHAASENAMQHPDLNSMRDMLYYTRRCPGNDKLVWTAIMPIFRTIVVVGQKMENTQAGRERRERYEAQYYGESPDQSPAETQGGRNNR